jgi:hypothetical protein
MDSVFQNGESTDQQGPRDTLDLQEQILRSSESNPLLRDTNLGQGNYDEEFLWQQIRSYRKGIYAYTAFATPLLKRAIHETIVKLGREGYNAHYDTTDDDVKSAEPADLDDVDPSAGESKKQAILDRGREIWRELGDPHTPLSEKQVAAITKKTGISDEWKPIYWQMVAGRHEVSRSKDAELLRDLFTGIKHLRSEADEDSASILLGGN